MAPSEPTGDGIALQTVGGDLATIIRRAGEIGIPAWRVIVALGLPLPIR